MNTSKITSTARGPWLAVAVDFDGDVLDLDQPLDLEHLERVTVVRGSGVPVDRDGILRMPDTCQREDVLYEVENLGDEPDLIPLIWEQARGVAGALNALAQEASLADPGWIVARDGGRYCETCEGEVQRGHAYQLQPGTGGLLQHVHCPDLNAAAQAEVAAR